MRDIVRENDDSLFTQLELLRYVSGEAPTDERLAVERWMAADPANSSEVELLQRAWALSARSEWTEQDVGALWREMEQRIGGDAAFDARAASAERQLSIAPRLTLITPRPRAWWSSPTVLGAAAALILAIGTAFFYGSRGLRKGAAVTMRAYATQAGQRTELRLADGTLVKLDAATTLRAPASFRSGSYDVYLDGGAYFEVTHDSTRVFRVHTARGVTEDLGTRFAITAYASDSTESVAVADGSVMLHGFVGDPVALEAGDVARVSSAGVVSVARRVKVDRYFNQVDGLLEFDNVRLGDAVPALERQYDIEIRLKDSSLAKKRFTASFTAGNVDQLMNGLAFLLDARYERPGRGRVLILSPR